AEDPRGARPARGPRVGERRRGEDGPGRRDRGVGAALSSHRGTGHRGVIDTHAHLDACPDPPDELVRRAREAGVGTILTVGTSVEGSRTALALADEHDEVYAILGI